MYNPFKLWGSYVGLVIVISSTWLIIPALPAMMIMSLLGLCVGEFCTDGGNMPYVLYLFIIQGILGFLLGWGIHSLIRRIHN